MDQVCRLDGYRYYDTRLDSRLMLTSKILSKLATPKGFEPLTFGFGDQRSAGLNYGAIYIKKSAMQLGRQPGHDDINQLVRIRISLDPTRDHH